MTIDILQPEDVDVSFPHPPELTRVVEQNLIDLTPWLIMSRDLALKRLKGLRQRYQTKYVPFARRQDNDDLAVLTPDNPGCVLVVHDFADEGAEVVATYPSFWDWFRAAVDEMIAFE